MTRRRKSSPNLLCHRALKDIAEHWNLTFLAFFVVEWHRLWQNISSFKVVVELNRGSASLLPGLLLQSCICLISTVVFNQILVKSPSASLIILRLLSKMVPRAKQFFATGDLDLEDFARAASIVWQLCKVSNWLLPDWFLREAIGRLKSP